MTETNIDQRSEHRRRPYGALAFVALLILALFVRQRHSDIIITEAPSSDDNYVDTYTVEVSSQLYDRNGRKVRLLEADYAAHYALSDESILQAPSILSTSDSGKSWQTSARNGKVRPGGNIFDLWNTVLIQRVNGDTVMRSDTLTYHSDQGVAETKDEVVIDSKIGQTIGVGMTANINTEVIRLNSEVRSVFEPPR